VRATTLNGPGDIRVSEVPDPVIEQPTDVVVKVKAGCICGSDLWGYRGENPFRGVTTIGHECVGEVVEVGSDVSTYAVGDFVLVPFVQGDGTCPHCLAGMQSACTHKAITQSGQGEYARVAHADAALTRAEDDPALYPSYLALTDVMATGWHAAVAAGVKPGDTVVVVGDGAVGLSAVLAASTMGAERVVAMSRHEPRQRIATTFGATDLVAERGEEGEAAVLELTHGVGADAVLECVGTDASMSTAFKVARPGSTVGFVGVPHGVEPPVGRMFAKNVGLAGGMAPVQRYLPELLALVTSGRIEPGLVFDSAVALDDVAEGYRRMDQREAVKVQVNP
jgi:threonine dehydrogenase-like Zn-dependent dehydrogenase